MGPGFKSHLEPGPCIRLARGNLNWPIRIQQAGKISPIMARDRCPSRWWAPARDEDFLPTQPLYLPTRKKKRAKQTRGRVEGEWGGLRAKQAGIRHWTQSWSAVVMVMTLSSPFYQCDFSVSGEKGNSLSSKDVFSPSIFLGPNPLPSHEFRFALASSSLAIISALSTID